MRKSALFAARVGLLLILMLLFILIYVTRQESKKKQVIPPIEKSIDLSDTLSIYSVHDFLNSLGVKFPEVVACQSYLETGNYTSDICLNANNLFGMKQVYRRPHCQNGTYGSYAFYNHWVQSCIDYKYYQDFVLKDNLSTMDEYLDFLSKKRYFEDPNYIQKIKNIYGIYFLHKSVEEKRSD